MSKVVVITGANSGIGRAAAFKFAELGCEVVMACRDKERSKQVQEEIIQTTNNRHVHLMQVDMSSFSSIKEFNKEYKERFNKLDILIHNAAYINHGSPHRLNPDIIELTFATNVLGPFYMNELLRDVLKRGEKPVILNASSNIVKHFFDPKKHIHFEHLKGEWRASEPFSVYKQYCESKMALVILTFYLAEKYKEDGIRVNALQINGARMSPQTLNKFTLKWRLAARAQNVFFPPPEKMAKCYVDICTTPRFMDVTGSLMNDKLETMVRADVEPSVLKQVKQLTGSQFYPYYADNPEERKKLIDFCESIMTSYQQDVSTL
ncbi:SDR family NAD(P)-dependent oxidoreductase [Alkalihalophilus marmarensis]|uniref:Short-chain dehydrogenase n=1 Tax=Alkalihalophilus marmarensis DSM 21297 TaxID=1188261 RepID=U6SQK5_9BACI|nr:SDR family NAD(P)-dependent oxidoreductase [Alkalihalophilus marmarensis]ERN53672.1 short-chain dehydrogenase [Alkalihalophilus marmarensis DSM 21297]